MSKRVLVTGGAGFIGSHVADELISHGYQVRVLDCLSAQTHGPAQERPEYLNEEVELLVGDIRDQDLVRRALDGVDAVYHFAAMVGVGQSMYQIERYTGVNNLGTAVLLEALVDRPVERLVVASSMSIYGEGLYRTSDGRKITPVPRSAEQFEAGEWEVKGPRGDILIPVATPESKEPALASIYALSKYDQEQMCLLIGRAYGIPTVALRFFNVYGTRQALSNPYTGVLAIFASRLLNDRPPLVYEDGYQQRDFVNVKDVARACRLALEAPDAPGRAFNVGSGSAYTVRDIACQLALSLGKEVEPVISGKYRTGDIRHCFADITAARETLGYEPGVSLDAGLSELVEWLGGQVATDETERAHAELAARGL